MTDHKSEGTASQIVRWEYVIPNPDNYTEEEHASFGEKGLPITIKVWSADLEAYDRFMRNGELDAQVQKLAAVAEDLRHGGSSCSARDDVANQDIASQVLGRLSSALAEASKEPAVVEADEFVDQTTAPIPKTLFLRLARKRVFPSSKVGKTVLARRADVVAAIDARQQKPSAGGSSNVDDLDGLREQVGLVQKGAR